MYGGDLQKFLLSRGKRSEEIALPESDAKRVFRQILSALHYAHQNNVIHRDIKLENMYYTNLYYTLYYTILTYTIHYIILYYTNLYYSGY